MSEFTFPELSDLKTAYERDGYAIVRRVLDAQFVDEIQRHIDWVIERNPDLPTETLGHWLIADDPFWVRFVSDDRLLAVAEQLIGPAIAFFAADYICKAPAAGRPLLWHQDGNYWPLEPMEVVTFWFAVTESGPHNGGVRVIPESHRSGPIAHHDTTEDGNVLASSADAAAVDESKVIEIELQPGDISIHHPYTLHASRANTSDIWRKGGSIVYMPPTTKITDDNWPSAFLFRGDPVPGINHYLDKPRYDASRHMAFRGCDQWV